MAAYEAMIRNTATQRAPWYVVPADNKWFTRVVVAAAIIDALASLDLAYPEVDRPKFEELAAARSMLEAEEPRLGIAGRGCLEVTEQRANRSDHQARPSPPVNSGTLPPSVWATRARSRDRM